MNNQSNLAKLILRLGFGGLMLVHGISKMMMLFEGKTDQFPDPLHVGSTGSLILTVFAELICAGLIVIGYKTKWAVIPIIITMLVAAFIVHKEDPLGNKELALIYSIGFIAIGMLGAGKYSLDRK